MAWQLKFHFPGYPKIFLCAFVQADNEEKAAERAVRKG